MQALLHGCAYNSMSITATFGEARTVRVSHALKLATKLFVLVQKWQMTPPPTRKPWELPLWLGDGPLTFRQTEAHSNGSYSRARSLLNCLIWPLVWR